MAWRCRAWLIAISVKPAVVVGSWVNRIVVIGHTCWVSGACIGACRPAVVGISISTRVCCRILVAVPVKPAIVIIGRISIRITGRVTYAWLISVSCGPAVVIVSWIVAIRRSSNTWAIVHPYNIAVLCLWISCCLCQAGCISVIDGCTVASVGDTLVRVGIPVSCCVNNAAGARPIPAIVIIADYSRAIDVYRIILYYRRTRVIRVIDAVYINPSVSITLNILRTRT